MRHEVSDRDFADPTSLDTSALQAGRSGEYVQVRTLASLVGERRLVRVTASSALTRYAISVIMQS